MINSILIAIMLANGKLRNFDQVDTLHIYHESES